MKQKFLYGLLLGRADDRVSLSKFVMFIGLFVSSGVLIYDVIHNGLNLELFLIYIGATLGTNSVNKGLSIVEQIKTRQATEETKRVLGNTETSEEDE